MNKVYYIAWLVSGKLKKFPTLQVLAIVGVSRRVSDARCY
jgi:hypothetical protein